MKKLAIAALCGSLAASTSAWADKGKDIVKTAIAAGSF